MDVMIRICAKFFFNTIGTVPGSSLFCSAAPRHVDRDEELHVLVALPGEVVDGEQQHVRVGLGRRCYRVPGKNKEQVVSGSYVDVPNGY